MTLSVRTTSGRPGEVLRPGGWLALWWNRPDEDGSALGAEINAAYDRVAPELSVRRIGSPGPPNREQLDLEPLFQLVTERVYPWSQTYTAAEWTDLLRTQSDHRLLPRRQQTRLLEHVAAAIERHGGRYEHRYVAWLVLQARG